MPAVVIAHSRPPRGASVSAAAGVAAATGQARDGAVGTGLDYYISPSGSDSTGNGSVGSPWASVSKFLALPPQAGNTLYCRGGTYGGTLNRNRYVYGVAGAEGRPITIRNYPGETPIFDGESNGSTTTYREWLELSDNGSVGSAWWVIDGLTFIRMAPTQTGVIAVGINAQVSSHHVTVRNCNFTIITPTSNGDHGVYAGKLSRYITVEDCHFTGPYPGVTTTGAAVHLYGTPSPLGDLVVNRCIIEHFQEGIQIWDANATGSITHCSFLDCQTNIDLRVHSWYTVRDNAGETAAGGSVFNLYQGEPTFEYGNYTSYTTADHNFWGQTFDADYYLLDGQTGRNAASDGTDAGALNVGQASGTLGLATATGSAHGPSAQVSGGTYESTCLADSPTFLLPMDEASGNLSDIVGSKTATASGTPTYGVTGPVTGHTAVQFSDVTDYFTVTDHADLDLGDGPFTIEFWLYRDTDAGAWQYAFAKGANAYGVAVDMNDRYALAKSEIAELAYTSTVTAGTGAWHHVAITRTATRPGTQIIYVDGVAVTTGTLNDATTLSDTTSALTIGRENTAQEPILGRLAYIAFYKSVLSDTRIAAHYAARTLG